MEIKSQNKGLGNVTYFSYLLPRQVVLCFRSILEQEKAVMRALIEGLNPFQLQISVQATVGSAENSRLTCLKSHMGTEMQVRTKAPQSEAVNENSIKPGPIMKL